MKNVFPLINPIIVIVYLDFIATNLPTFGLPYSCLSKVCVVVQDEGHPFQSIKHNLKKDKDKFGILKKTSTIKIIKKVNL